MTWRIFIIRLMKIVLLWSTYEELNSNTFELCGNFLDYRYSNKFFNFQPSTVNEWKKIRLEPVHVDRIFWIFRREKNGASHI